MEEREGEKERKRRGRKKWKMMDGREKDRGRIISLMCSIIIFFFL